MHDIVLQPLEGYYFDREAEICDVPHDIHDQCHDYGPPRNRSIEVLSDYDALHYINFTKIS